MPHNSNQTPQLRMKLVTATTAAPLTLTEAKLHLRSSTGSNAEDSDITIKLNAAAELAERIIPGHRQFMPATYELVLSHFPFDTEMIELPRPPAQSITTIKYYNTTGALTTLDSARYQSYFPTHGKATVEPVFSKTWPATRQRQDAVTIRYIAGYATAAKVPFVAKAAVALILGHLHENREDVHIGALPHKVQMGAESLLRSLDYGFYG